MTIDKVLPLKIETAVGGDDADRYPTSVDPNEDYIACRGLALQDDVIANADDLVLVERVAATNTLQFTDAVVGTKSLSQTMKHPDRYYYMEDFGGSAITADWTSTVSGTGSTVANVGLQAGVVKLTAGAANGRYAILQFGALDWLDIANNITFQARCKVTIGGDSNCVIILGLYDLDAGYGVTFKQDTTDSGNWYCSTKNAVSETTTDSEIAPSTSVWVKFKIITAAAIVDFYIDDVLIVQHDTSLFTGDMTPYFYVKSLESATQEFAVDYLYLECDK